MRRAILLSTILLSACASVRPLSPVGRVRLALAQDLATRRDYAGAVALVQQIHADDAPTPETLTLRGTILRERGAYDDAERDLEGALRLDRSYAPAHDALAILYDLRGRADVADQHHRRAIELEEHNATYRNNWGYALLLRNRPAEAIECLREAVRLDPSSQRFRNNLGFAYARGGDFKRAVQQFELAGPPAEARNNLGVAYETAGNLPQAFEAYLEAVRLDPGLKSARANLLHAARALDRAVPPDVGAAGTGAGGKS